MSSSGIAPQAVANCLLRLLPANELVALLPKLRLVALTPKEFLLEPAQPVAFIHFVEQGSVSMIAVGDDGEENEVGLVGFEGLVGLPLVLNAPASAFQAMVQAEGSALRLRAENLLEAMTTAPTLPQLMLRYADAFLFQVAQTAICNSRHHIEQRAARWILATHDRVGRDRFLLTQEFLSRMLGVRRSGVTVAIGALHRAGLIQHHRGEVTILDREGLEAATCKCAAAVRRHSAWLHPRS